MSLPRHAQERRDYHLRRAEAITPHRGATGRLHDRHFAHYDAMPGLSLAPPERRAIRRYAIIFSHSFIFIPAYTIYRLLARAAAPLQLLLFS